MSTDRTGWPPGLLQDDSKPLSRWFASRVDAAWRAREVAKVIKAERMQRWLASQPDARAAAILPFASTEPKP